MKTRQYVVAADAVDALFHMNSGYVLDSIDKARAKQEWLKSEQPRTRPYVVYELEISIRIAE